MSLARLAPFLATSLIYWVCFIPESEPSFTAMALKVLPTVSLAWGVSRGSGQATEYQEGIAIGLVLSAVGDAFLVWKEFLVLGILAFGCAHVKYIRSLVYRSWPLPKPLFSSSPGLGVFLFSAATVVWYIFLREGLAATGDTVLSIGVPLYIGLLTCTVWRSGVDGDWMMFVGALLFYISDLCIGLNMFYKVLPKHQVLIMSTYYVGQMFIALSSILEDDLKKLE